MINNTENVPKNNQKNTLFLMIKNRNCNNNTINNFIIYNNRKKKSKKFSEKSKILYMKF